MPKELLYYLAATLAFGGVFAFYSVWIMRLARRPSSDQLLIALVGLTFPIWVVACTPCAFWGPFVFLPIAFPFMIMFHIVTRRSTIATLAPFIASISAFAVLTAPGLLTRTISMDPWLITAAAVTWHIVTLAGLLWWLHRYKASPAYLPWTCRRCLYDLRNLPPETTKCPECGQHFRWRKKKSPSPPP